MTRRTAIVGLISGIAGAEEPPAPDPQLFFEAIGSDNGAARRALDALSSQWRDSYAIILLELLRTVVRDRPGDSPGTPSPASAARNRIFDYLGSRTKKGFGTDSKAWNRWAWALPYDPHPDYARLKGFLYSKIDPRMAEFFPEGVRSNIRLDQVEWGGVRVNGIPPLVNPATIPAAEAKYLKDSNVVFGIEIGNEARAYPKRILAWHEMARDRIGGVDLAIVYCTLCGTVIPYRTEVDGRRFVFGTSGLLFESSKLMFDEETKSLWSTLQGRPVIGRLASEKLQLAFEPVVTTTWGEWKQDHPATTVLSLDTGHERDYSEGAAYRDYFDTDELMFQVSRMDRRLKNKDEILAIRLPGKTPLAIAAKFLRRRPEFTLEHEGVALTIRTSKGGANVVSAGGKRIPAHRAFWFGWWSQYSDSRVIH